MRRFVMMVALVLVAAATVVSCEDDSVYKAGPSTFQNDVLDAGADAAP